MKSQKPKQQMREKATPKYFPGAMIGTEISSTLSPSNDTQDVYRNEVKNTGGFAFPVEKKNSEDQSYLVGQLLRLRYGNAHPLLCRPPRTLG